MSTQTSSRYLRAQLSAESCVCERVVVLVVRGWGRSVTVPDLPLVTPTLDRDHTPLVSSHVPVYSLLSTVFYGLGSGPRRTQTPSPTFLNTGGTRTPERVKDIRTETYIKKFV